MSFPRALPRFVVICLIAALAALALSACPAPQAGLPAPAALPHFARLVVQRAP